MYRRRVGHSAGDSTKGRPMPHSVSPVPQGRSPRICMPTWWHFRKNTYRCGLYEAQDVLSEIDDVDLIRLEPAWAEWVSEHWLRRPLYHDRFSKLILANPGLRKYASAGIMTCSSQSVPTFWTSLTSMPSKGGKTTAKPASVGWMNCGSLTYQNTGIGFLPLDNLITCFWVSGALFLLCRVRLIILASGCQEGLTHFGSLRFLIWQPVPLTFTASDAGTKAFTARC